MVVQHLTADESRLQAGGYRLTGPRRVILGALRDAGRYLTPQQLYERLRGRTVGLASVYRTLELLADLGLAEKRAEPGGEASFLYCSPRHHHHAICTRCNAVLELDETFCPEETVLRTVERTTGFQIHQHTVDFYGLCPACQAAT